MMFTYMEWRILIISLRIIELLIIVYVIYFDQANGNAIEVCLPNQIDSIQQLDRRNSVTVSFESSASSRARGFLFEYQGNL